MHNFKKKLSLFSIIVLLTPIIDLLISFVQMNFAFKLLGSAIRGILLIVIVLNTIFFKKKSNSKTINYILVLVFFILFFVIYKNFNLKEMIGIIKFFFFPIILCCFLIYKDDFSKLKENAFASGIIYTILLIIPIITSTALNSYDSAKEGLIGWFYSPNEVSAIISLLTPFMIVKILETNNYKTKILLTIISIVYIFIIFTIGTKTPVFAIFITIIIYIILSMIKLIIEKNKKKYNLLNIGILIIVLLTSIQSFTSGTSLNNIVTQGNNYENITSSKDDEANNNIQQENEEHKITDEKNHITDIINTEKSEEEDKKNNANKDNHLNLKNNEYKKNKFLNLIFSSRDVYLINRFQIWKSTNFNAKMFGIGQIIQNNNTYLHKLIEIDFFDIFFCYGIIGFIIYFIPLFIVMFILFKYLIKNFKKIIINYNYWPYYISIGLGIFISSLAGHVLGAPSVSLILAIIISVLFNKIYTLNLKEYKFINKKRILILSIILLLCIICGIII